MDFIQAHVRHPKSVLFPEYTLHVKLTYYLRLYEPEFYIIGYVNSLFL